jgi:hypothetical protein
MKIGVNVKTAIAAGIINCIAWYLFAKMLGFYSLNIYNYRFLTTLFLLITGVVISIFYERKSLGGFIEFKIALKTGVVFSIILGGILALFNFIYHKFIVPDAVDFFISEERKAWLDHNKTLEEVNKYLVEYYIPTFGSFHILMTTLIWGILLSLLTGAILSKKKPAMPFSEN